MQWTQRAIKSCSFLQNENYHRVVHSEELSLLLFWWGSLGKMEMLKLVSRCASKPEIKSKCFAQKPCWGGVVIELSESSNQQDSEIALRYAFAHKRSAYFKKFALQNKNFCGSCYFFSTLMFWKVVPSGVPFRHGSINN